MTRAGFSKEDLDVAKGVFKVLWRGDLNRRQAIARLQDNSEWAREKITREIIAFTESSERGLA
jgi:acyl-[acyl carrier protein]--UDP-N-acetylglucosamine O-acyltransferase